MSKPKISLITLATLAVTAAASTPAATANPTPAKPPYFNAFLSRYPNSDSGTNASCMLCHRDITGDDPWNAYGWDVRTALNMGGGIDLALANVEGLDSDGDPTGSSNLAEINASSQPGWTVGPNNTIFFENGTTTPNQNPPAGVTGDLDPACGGAATGNYCSSAPFSTGTSTITVSPSVVSISANPTMTATANNLPSQPGIFVAGPGQASIPFFNGTLCVSPSGLQRFAAVNVPSGGIVSQNFTIADAAPGGLNVVSNQTYNFQRWNRDPAAGGGAANFSDGFAVCFTP